MTKLLLSLLVLIIGTVEEPPRPFESIVHATHPADYYTEQAGRWAEVAGEDCATEADYLEYYLAARYANRYAGGNYNLEGIARQAGARLDSTGFALNYLRYVHRLEGDGYDYLRAAYAVDPDHRYVQHAMLGYAMINGETDLATTLSQQQDRLAPYPTGLNDYNYNTLASVAENGILITFGDADTYPAWVLQHAHGVRPDVLIVNFYLLGYKEAYATRIFAAAGLSEAPAADVTDRLAQLRTSARPLHLAGTVGGRIDSLGIAKEAVYTVGLTFRISDSPVENLSATRRLYEDVWRLDQVRAPLSDSPQSRVGEQYSPNYLVPLIELLKQQSGPVEDQQLRELIDGIARRNELTARVAALLGEATGEVPQLASDAPGLDTKSLLQRFKHSVPSRMVARRNRPGPSLPFGMQENEVSNVDYQLFLQDLLRQRKFDYLDTAAVLPADWAALLPDSIAALPEEVLFARGRPEEGQHPVLNISHRAAQLYAFWLTQAYNQDPKRKEVREIRFRLPTAAEFELAARGGHENAPYPWGSPYYRNARGTIQANLNTLLLDDKWVRGDYDGISGRSKLTGRKIDIDPNYRTDGAYVTAEVWYRYPNNFGLYNMAGNAAEMTDIDGQTMGGSWLDGPEALQNGVITERRLPSPTTGFRLVMEYIEE